MRQENERVDEEECVQNSGKTGTDVRAETWALMKAQEKKLEVAEMRMLRCVFAVTKLVRIRNERIMGTTKVGESQSKSRKAG